MIFKIWDFVMYFSVFFDIGMSVIHFPSLKLINKFITTIRLVTFYYMLVSTLFTSFL